MDTERAAADLWIKIQKESKEEYKNWVIFLREKGIIAAHSDDGWVDREKNTLNLVYPEFNDGVKVGSLIALGCPEKYRVVKIIGQQKFPSFVSIEEITIFEFKKIIQI